MTQEFERNLTEHVFPGGICGWDIRQQIMALSLWARRLLPACAFSLLACSDITGTPELPAGTQNSEYFNSRAGAVGLHRNISVLFGPEMVRAAVTGGFMTDELQASASLGNTNPSTTFPLANLDARNSPTDVRGIYSSWQWIRNQARQGIALAAKYGLDLPAALSGELYAIQGYSVLILADFFCSGIPLSTIDFEKDYTYGPGLPTSDLYARAVALFDTALTLSADSSRILNLARVGKGRALLALGRYADAGDAVALVPEGFRYQSTLTWRTGSAFVSLGMTMADKKGMNGYAYRTSGDPRTDTAYAGTTTNGIRLYFPKKFPLGVASPYVIADWTEAQLILVESQLHTPNVTGWLATLNRLRTSASSALTLLEDPGTDSARMEVLFRERAFWLYLRGHRQGDLRRMVRQYRRPIQTVYPIGVYPGVGMNVPKIYGLEVVLPIPEDELRNPLFNGCLNYDA